MTETPGASPYERRPSTPPIDWQWLTPRHDGDPSGYNSALQALTTWVDWLTTRYELQDTIPPCWPQHGPILEELSALETAWRGAYHDPDAHADAGLRWHEQLHTCLDRITHWNKEQCTPTTHRQL